jgi:hypothetical protein
MSTDYIVFTTGKLDRDNRNVLKDVEKLIGRSKRPEGSEENDKNVMKKRNRGILVNSGNRT